MRNLTFDFRPPAGRPCRIRLGRGAWDALVEDLVAAPPGDPIVTISDSTVDPLCAAPLRDRVAARGLGLRALTFPAGEANKTRQTKAALEDGLFDIGAGRDAAIVAVGGGVTGDLAGFVASTWHRGVPVVQVPTSLLAMADSALGGKTGLNLAGGKNLVGTFHQSWGIYADTDALRTLPDRHFIAGLAEVVKSGVIADVELFDRLECTAGRLQSRDPRPVEEAIEACLRVKGAIVLSDEREVGPRASLNFGHTVAHALETVTGFTLLHGEAVAIGMVVECRLAEDATGFPAGDSARVEALLGALGLPTRVPSGIDVASALAVARRDKKARRGRARYALPGRIGTMPADGPVTVEVDDAVVEAAIERFRISP